MRCLQVMQPIPDALVAYHGPSALDGAPVVVVLTGLTKASANTKTGATIQSWILRADVSPRDAQRTGQDATVCGDCPMRPLVRASLQAHPTKQAPRYACYVKTYNAPRSIWSKWMRSGYGAPSLEAAADAVHRSGRMLRLGSYGDPFAVPEHSGVLQALTDATRPVVGSGAGWLGYTHQWRQDAAQWLRGLTMASCENGCDLASAEALGWRGFLAADEGIQSRTGPSAAERSKTAAVRASLWAHHHVVACPAVTHEGATCASCGLCDGARFDTPRAHVALAVHT